MNTEVVLEKVIIRIFPELKMLLPEIRVEEIIGGPLVPIEIAKHPGDDGALPKNQLAILLAILWAKRPKVILEVGTFMGTTTCAMAETLPGSIVHTIDLPPGANVPNEPGKDGHLVARRIVGRDYVGKECAKRIRQHFCNTLRSFPQLAKVDLFFIDGDHSFDGCLNDSLKCLGLVQYEPAIFIWHDYAPTHPGVQSVLHQWRYGLGRDVRQISGLPMGYWSKP